MATAVGIVFFTRDSARSTAASSPRNVLPATITGLDGDMRKNRSSRGRTCGVDAGISSESNFRLPVTVTRDGSAPRSISRRADSSLCMQKPSTCARTRLKNGRARRYRGYERDEIRPLIITVVTPRLRQARRRLGQISVSIMMNMRGFTTSSMRRTMKAKSNGK
jgi:hypothetical protein